MNTHPNQNAPNPAVPAPNANPSLGSVGVGTVYKGGGQGMAKEKK